MANNKRIEQLMAAGVAQNAQFSERAQQVLNSLSEDEFNLLLSMRSKVQQAGGPEAQQEYDRFLAFVI